MELFEPGLEIVPRHGTEEPAFGDHFVGFALAGLPLRDPVPRLVDATAPLIS
ncbi:MAG TPA: hypothetical protein VKY81_00195 [Natronosporangium sp.]|nr:hypothetical protein [Natronosporangium sp.]